MNIRTKTLASDILSYLNENGEVVRKNLYVPFSEYAYQYYARTLRRLIDKGYVETKRVSLNSVTTTRVSLTKKGQELLRDSVGDTPNKKKDSKTRPRRQQLVVPVTGLCAANGFLVSPDEKPRLESLFPPQRAAGETRGNLRGPNERHPEVQEGQVEAQKDFFDACLETGIFYSSTELRKAYLAIFAKNEVMNLSRLVGILLFRGSLKYVYSVGEVLIEWRSSCEEKTVKAIQRFLFASPIIRDSLNIEEKDTPECIVVGKGMTMIPKLVYGRRWGRTQEQDVHEKLKSVLAVNHANAHNFAKVFSAAYYVSNDKRGIESFRLAAMMTRERSEELCDKWYGEVPSVTRVRAFGYHLGLTSKRERVTYMPNIDLIELEYYKKQGEPMHFVIPMGTQEAISRVMGPLLLSAQSLKGNQLKYNPYDKHGAPVKAQPEANGE